MKLKGILFLFFVLMGLMIQAQKKFIGSGNTKVVVTTSNNSEDTHGDHVLSGKGLHDKYYDAARFLTQASLTYREDDIDALVAAGRDYEAWIDAQAALPSSSVTDLAKDIFKEARDLYVENTGKEAKEYGRARIQHFNYAYWQNLIPAEDQLRHRIALALSEIFVISGDGNLAGFGYGMAAYYDLLQNNAFGNFRDLLHDVTYNPCMGFYLSHINNKKSTGKQRPDENYAREIMQLFTIGLYELNLDGSYKLDAAGEAIPTYGQTEIKEFAKVFTGLYGDGWAYFVNKDDKPNFGTSAGRINKQKPMIMSEEHHEPGIKYLLNGATTNGTGNEDISNALDNLFNHPNVGPFIARRLIQRLVKSNPTPAYITRVASAFNDTNGVRGDMLAVVKAILLDEEARLGKYMLAEHSGMLREPLVKHINAVGNLNYFSESGNLWNNGVSIGRHLGQNILQAPSVFNFFQPDFKPAQLDGLYGPEYQIFNTITAINWVNLVHQWTIWEVLYWDWEGDYTPNVLLNYEDYDKQVQNEEAYINYLDKILTHGSLTDFTRSEIRKVIRDIYDNRNKAKMALYLVLISPEFSVIH